MLHTKNKATHSKTMQFLATAATALVLGTSAYADAHTTAFMEFKFDAAQNLNASELIGMRVYASESDIANEPLAADGEKEWDDIGEINEIVLTRSGEVSSVIVGVGGFLSIGEKDVAIDMSQLQIVADQDDADDFFLVIKANVAGVTDAPSYTRADTDMGSSMGRSTLTPPMINRDGYEAVVIEQLTSEMLTGARVYGLNDEDVGEISELLLAVDGKIERAVIDVGGFLGMGEKPVAVTLEELTIMQSEGDVRVYIESTQEALEAQPNYDG
ncbi:hypothetical protein ROLI_029960 [Roseobacter fucihabitans]|uniref:PRC-barrel domain-containing protein n=1 Tax=Roseobacter fucihabitans TaxID=1537242 RepID=A0ABZ2BX56_9RHOB|nr:PRC-barrel domain-containing protein [Roseobacter litoralis]MBC6967215.1 PRC-barrel domain protein [Roseobacter litoralis]